MVWASGDAVTALDILRWGWANRRGDFLLTILAPLAIWLAALFLEAFR